MINKIKRNPQKFDSFDLYSTLCAKNSLDINDLNSVESVIQLVKDSIKENKKNLNLVFGKRIESMFATVAASLGQCVMIKQEDGGETFCNDKISIPDYRIVLKNEKNILIEVKNYHRSSLNQKFSFTEKYFDSILKYAQLVNCEVKFAIYYSFLNYWVLLSPNAFSKHNRKYIISFEDAMKKNEMQILGDQMIATESPIELYFSSDTTKESTFDFDTGEAKFIIGDILCYCNGRKITDDFEKQLISHFTMYSSWEEKETLPIMSGDRLIALKFKFEPHEVQEENGFHLLGTLSSMASQMYRSATEREGKVVAIETTTEPKSFSVIIPEDYDSTNLPLWRFRLQPNEG